MVKDIKDIVNSQKNKKDPNTNKTSKTYKRKANNKRNKKKKKSMNFPPKKYQINFINNNKKADNDSKKYILDTNVKKPNLILSNKFVTNNEDNLNKKIKIEFTDYELNMLNYTEALSYDKRTLCQYYISLLRKKHPILFGFCPNKDYNSMIIKSSLICLSFTIYYAINFAFFNEEMIHKLYENGGKYEINYFFKSILFSFVISYIINIIIKLIFLSERNLMEIKKQPTFEASNDIVPNVKRNLVIKYIIYFIAGLIFLFFFWLLLSSFGAVYQNTQIIIFENALISFGISLFFPFFINIFPCIFRYLSLNSQSKNMECLYKFSKFLQYI